MDRIEALYRQYASAVLRYAWGLSGDAGTAEDIVSETFVRLLTRAPRIQTRTALAYLLAIARNCYLTGLRRTRREVELPEGLLAPEGDPDGALDAKRRLEAAVLALQDLPEGERSALLLRVDHELPYEEIARTLGISPGAAKVRVHRARLHLARVMAQRQGDQDAV